MNVLTPALRNLMLFTLIVLSTSTHASDQPNVVLIVMDNLGWGQLYMALNMQFY